LKRKLEIENRNLRKETAILIYSCMHLHLEADEAQEAAIRVEQDLNYTIIGLGLKDDLHCQI
jgi:hypothetical protein